MVIGETCEIGARVKLYHHVVTLGARSFLKRSTRVIVVANAIQPWSDERHDLPELYRPWRRNRSSACSTIGGNVFLVQSVPPDSLVYYEEKQLQIVPKTKTAKE